MITQEELKEILHYNKKTGLFTWRVDRGTNKLKGKIAGTLHSDGYIQIRINNKSYRASRLGFLYVEGYFPENKVDHKNRIRTDNKWKNLRHVSSQCNARNRNLSKRNKTGTTGVSWYKPDKKFQARIRANNKNIFLGYFDSLKDAAQARWKAEVKYGFPNCNTTSTAYQYLQKGEK